MQNEHSVCSYERVIENKPNIYDHEGLNKK